MYKPPKSKRKSKTTVKPRAAAVAPDTAKQPPSGSEVTQTADNESRAPADAPKPGRHPIPEDQRRSVMIRVMVNEADYKRFQKAADADSRTLSTWFLQLAVAATKNADTP